MFSSTATDPAEPLEPEVAKNGNIYNIWTLDLKTGELQQYTDALGGNLSPVVLNDGSEQPQLAFVSYYKGEYGLHTSTAESRSHTAATADFGAPGPDHRLPGAAHPHAGRRTTRQKKGRSRRCSSRAGRR